MESVVVKFVKGEYGFKAHECLAAKNLAPKILHMDNLPGGWVVVVMEKNSYTVICQSREVCSFFAFSCEDLTFKWLCTWRSSCSEYSASKRQHCSNFGLWLDWLCWSCEVPWWSKHQCRVAKHQCRVAWGGLILPEHVDYQIQQIFEQQTMIVAYTTLYHPVRKPFPLKVVGKR